MKNISTFLFLFFVITLGLNAQDCEPYFPVQQGATSTYTNYDAKGKVEGKNVQTLLKKEEIANGIAFTAKTTSYDNKDKELASTEFSARCENGTFYVDMAAMMMNNEQMSNYENMEMSISGDDMSLPSDVKAGQTLPDATMKISISTGVSTMTVNIMLTERKVEAIEEVTTPAGTFSCVKLSYKVTSEFGPIKTETKSVDYFSKNVGMVRQESYKKNGKLMSYSELTAQQ